MAPTRPIVLSTFLALMVLSTTRSDESVPPTPDQEQASLRLADPALRIELAAAEPEVRSPVAVCWDERGRLYVAEMLDYPDASTAGKIKRLVDRDGDGRFETATVFAEGLPFPSGVLPWNGGVLVTAAPDILFFKDNDDDGVADERQVILTGFAEGNQQLRVNGLSWGLDNWVYVANGRSGGAIRRPGDPGERAVPIPRNDFRFRPETGEVEALAGFSQFGLPRDDWGHRFPSWNTVPFRHVVLETRDLARDPRFLGAATTAEILDPADPSRVFSIAPAPTTFNGEPIAFFNASCGPTIYRGDALPESYRGDAFVCESLTSLVHRRELVADGATFQARRVEAGKEFLASTHPWFRPVNLATGPDGALYVVDFCRAMVEHPAFVPEGRGEGVDFRRGHEFGRLWRIVSADSPSPRPVRLDGDSPSQLVARLESPNGWVRDTAQRLLVERHDLAVVPRLKRAVEAGPNPAGRAQALATLRGLDAMDTATLREALADLDPRVVEVALRLAEGRSAEVADRLPALADSADAPVRLLSALRLGDLETTEARDALARIAGRDADDRWIRLAVLSGVGRSSAEFLETLGRDAPGWLDAPTPGRAALLEQLGEMIAAGNGSEPRERAAALAASRPHGEGSFALAAGLGSRGQPRPESLRPVVKAARTAADDDGASPAKRAAAVRLVASSGEPIPAAWLDADQPREVQAEAVRALAESEDLALAKAAIDGWPTRASATRRELLAVLTRSPSLAGVLLDGVEEDRVPLAEVDPATREALRRLPDPALTARVAKLLKDSAPAADRAEVLRRYETALTLPGDPKRGAELFERNCLSCHRRGDRGHRVGPDLVSVAGRQSATLLSDILDPNREVAPESMNVLVLTTGGQVLGGLIAEETPSAILLRRAEGIEETVPRAEIAELRPTGQSLMPVGLEQSLNPKDMADLIALLRGGLTIPN